VGLLFFSVAAKLGSLAEEETANTPSHAAASCFRLEAITLMDMEDLMAPAAFGDDDILGLLAGGSLSDALASQGALPIDRRRRDGAKVRSCTQSPEQATCTSR
jgi:hypothetical protein